jgi:hypothetical protein
MKMNTDVNLMLDPNIGLLDFVFDFYQVLFHTSAIPLISGAAGITMVSWALIQAWRIRFAARWALMHEQSALDDAKQGLWRLRLAPGDVELAGESYLWIEAGELRRRRDLPSVPFEALAEIERGRAVVPTGYRGVESRPARLRIDVACPSFSALSECAWTERRTSLVVMGGILLLPASAPLFFMLLSTMLLLWR